VDAVDGDVVALADVDRDGLPAEAEHLDDEALGAWLEGKRTKRAEIQAQLAELAIAREAFLADERARRHDEDPTRLDTAIVASILEQAKAAGFTIGRTAS
jgi:hypothetical protein